MSLLLTAGMLFSGTVADDSGIATAAAAEALEQCGSAVTPSPPDPRTINLVIDDSGSMFADDAGTVRDRWSQAKYSLEVFAALLDPADWLNVYRMSDFAGNTSAAAAVSLAGSEPASSRVSKIHQLQLQGGNTPYAPVNKAYQDLLAADTATRWLMILTDGEFNDRPTAEVAADVLRFAASGSSESATLRVGVLAIGQDAPRIPDTPQRGVYFRQATGSSDLLSKMTDFAGIIFQRSALGQSEAGRVSPDIDLKEVTVFAQGAGVVIGDLNIAGQKIKPASTVDVSWVENKDAIYGSARVPAIPNKQLKGKLATYASVPHGDGVFDVSGAQTVDIYYKPDVNFGVQLQDVDGRAVDANKIVAGDYTLYYGFMDEKCQFIESPLLGEIEYSARVLQGDDTVVEAFGSGDTLTLERGNAQLAVNATYDGGTASSVIDLTVLQPARATGIENDHPVLKASELADSYVRARAIAVNYGLGSAGALTSFSDEEWASVTADSFTVTSPSNLEFEVVVENEPGKVLLIPHAADGDVMAVETGEVPISIAVSHVYDEQLYEAAVETTVTVEDDISWWDRFSDWFTKTGWWVMLSLLLLVIVVGYLVKARFPRKIKRRPVIAGTPLRIGMRAEEANGKFTVHAGRRFLPFVADTASLTYVHPGVTGFRPFKLKAARGGKMQLSNWKQIAERDNVDLNGNRLNDETRRMPVLSPATTITATVPQSMRYEMHPNT